MYNAVKILKTCRYKDVKTLLFGVGVGFAWDIFTDVI